MCLGLVNNEYWKLVKESYKSLSLSRNSLKIELPVNKSVKASDDLLLRNLDCAVIKFA